MTAETLEKQQNPAFDPAASVFVAANAGAGKTSLLTGRVLSLLLSGAHPSKILCLTYTKGAAGEMMGRVLDTLSKWVMDNPEELARKLYFLLGAAPEAWQMARARSLFASVLEAPEGLKIQTIHGFCQSLLGRFPIEAGISPHFSVMDGRTEQELLAEARIRLFNHARHGDERLQPALRRLAHELSESTLGELIAEIIKDKRRFSSLLEKEGGAQAAIDALWRLQESNPTDTFETLAAQHFAYTTEQLATLRQAANVLLATGKSTDAKTGQGLADFLEKQLYTQEGVEHYLRLYLTQDNTPRKTVFTQALTDSRLVEALEAERERAMGFYRVWSAHRVAAHSADMLCLAEALLGIYTTLKHARAQMDYDDLILGACRLLAKEGIAPWVLFKLDGGIDHILVDEAQDTSAEQWQIVDALTQEFFAGQGQKEGDRSLFIVGDEKQSIFSFQGAAPSALGKMQQHFKQRISAAAKPVHNVQLTRSYRSLPEVLSAVDAVFAQEHARKGLMFQDAPLEHAAHRNGQGLVELWPLVEAEDEDEFALSATTVLARRMATTIKDWLDSGQMLPAKGRAIHAGDIMVLVRTRTHMVEKLTRALKRLGVPVAGRDRMALGENLAVQDLMALGQVLLLPEDDLTLAALLKSPLFDISEDALFELAYGRGERSLWDRLRERADKRPEFTAALELLEDMRARADYTRPYELYAYLLDTRGGRRRFIGRMGDEYHDPIDEFLAQAMLYESSHAPSLQGFLHWLECSDSEIKRDMEQSHQAVRIMTVHASKGLQAPIVFLPDTLEVPTLSHESLMWHQDEAGLLPLRAPSAKALDEHTSAIREQKREEMLAEYRRLLYVALTRAEDRVYVCGAAPRGKAPNPESWYALVSSGFSSLAQMQEQQGVKRLGEVAASITPPSTKAQQPAAAIPVFLAQQPMQEPSPPRPLSPSRPEGQEPAASSPLGHTTAYMRGNFIHALLQYLPEVEDAQRAQAVQKLAALRAQGLSEQEVQSATAEVLSVLRDERFAFLFGAGSLAEVPVAGCVELDGKQVAVSGQIDRLYLGSGEIWIVDFKSNVHVPRAAEDVPVAYKRQLRLYQRVLQAIYPQKPVRCALLWTSSCELTVLDEAHLAT